MRGNKGEWSELYALLRLLADGKIKAGINDQNCWLPVLKIFREDVESFKFEFRRSEKDFVELYLNGDCVRKIKSADLSTMAEKILGGINLGGDSAFEIDGAAEIMNLLGCKQIKSPANRKADIEVKVHDPFTNFDRICCYSIKSDLGHPPTLFNASQATNFKFKVFGMSDALAERINSIDTRTKIQDRMSQIERLTFVSVVNKTFAENLKFIDTQLEKFLGELLKIYYRENKWNGIDEANGGYLIVKESGEILAYHLYNRDDFETYLLNNTRLETPSSKRHRFATVYREVDGGEGWTNSSSTSTCRFVLNKCVNQS